MTTNGGDSGETSVQVALRVRPQNAKEQIEMCQICTFCTPNQPHIILGKDKAFTYDFVFDTESEQDEIYTQTVEPLVAGCFDGYNATVLAYGQTGSGKTYTMGTGFDMGVLPEQQGVIPRAVRQLFTTIDNMREDAIARGDPPAQFEITAQFLELYNEELIDLFDCNRDALKKLRIHEDLNGSIYITGVIAQRVESEEETLSCLKQGALSRTVGSTNMNAQSSRSHAIFTLHISQQRPIKTPVNNNSEGVTEVGGEGNVQYEISDWERLTAKFHFVDLAGSERLKRTGATGDRAKEGISINCGLLALGNVISALGDKAKKGSHVPYRDSKLSRLLQDSLGGNSRTLMVACVSPTDRDFMETLNTLKYANRARNIKNKVSVNQDKTSQQLTQFRSRIQELESELQEFHSGRKVVSEDGSVVMNDLASEVTMLRAENDKLRLRVKSLQQVIDTQCEKMASLAADRELAALGHHDESTGQVVGQESSEGKSHLPTVIKGYMKQIEELKSRLVLSESLGQHNPSSPYRRPPSLVMQGRLTSLHTRQSSTNIINLPFNQETSELLETARTDIVRLRQRHDRKASESESSRRGNRPRSRDIASTISSGSLDVVNEGVVMEGRSKGGEGSRDDEETLFGSDDDTNSTNEESSEEDLTVHGSDSSDESEDELDDSASLASSVADISSEIDLKEQLVDQLEKAQKNLHVMRQQYEDKMTLLQTQIHTIEAERDTVLKDISSQRSRTSGVSSKDVKARYEKQLMEMKTELKSLKLAKKEHSKAMKKNAQNENELRRLKADLLEMKKARVKMLNQMRMETSRKKQEDARSMRQISQLKKESRKKEHKIQSLEADVQRKAIVMKRKADELALLRRQTRMRHSASSSSISSTSSLTTSTTSSTNTQHTTHHPSVTNHSSVHPSGGGHYGESEVPSVVFRDRPSVKSLANRFERNNRRKSSIFSSNSARKKWRDFEKKITDAIMNRLTISRLSTDMDRWIEKRDRLSRKADELRHHKQQLMKESSPDPEELQSVDEDLDSLLANVEYIQSNIVELQNDLIAIDDSKNDSDTMEAHAIISQCGPRDAKYLLEHLLTMTLGLGVKAEQQASLARSLQARLKTSEDNAELMKSFSSPQVGHPLVMTGKTIVKSRRGEAAGGRYHSPVQLDFGSENSSQDTDDGTHLKRPKCKPQMAANNMITTSSKMRRRTYLPSEINPCTKKLPRPASATETNIQVEDMEHTDSDGSSVTGREMGKPCGGQQQALPTRRPLKKNGKALSSSVQDLLSIDAITSSSSATSLTTTASSPNASTARQLGGGGGGVGGKGDVWSRLTKSGSTNQLNDNRGQLQAERSRLATRHLTCTHTASGHSAGVLSVFATENLLFSGSQDRTVKIWDLKSGQEVMTLDKHFSYVRCVRYCSRNRIIFTASQSLIKIWDHRNFRGKCIKTFGPPHSGSGAHSGGDTVVQDLLLSSDTNTLFSAAGNVVNIWDFRKFVNRGRLVGHNGAVTALTLNQDTIMTGSRDRLIKLYDSDAVQGHSSDGITTSQSNVPPSYYPSVTLYPPHYDAVSSFAIHNNHLFSSCGCTFKQWDIEDKQIKQAVDGAHPQGTSITSLGVLSSPLTPLLVSGGKGGGLKLWNPETCANIGEVAAHKNAINSIATNETCIFTGSSDKTIRIWRSSPQDI